MFRTSTVFVALCLLASLHAQQGGRGAGAAAQPTGRIPSIEDRTAGMTKLDGYFPLYWDERTGNLWLEIPRFDTDFLYATGLAAGLGSNDIGLDRGQEGEGTIVSFQRVGPASSWCRAMSRSAPPAPIPRSGARWRTPSPSRVLWGFTVGAESNGHVLVDATDFFLRDGHGAGSSLGAGPAAYRVDRTRSAVYLPRTKAFPKNTEIEVTLTFTNETGGGRGGGGADPRRDRPPSSSPPPVARRARAPADAGDAAADCSPAPWPASRPRPKPSPCANTIRWSNCPTTTTAARRRSARRLRRPRLRRLQHAHRRAHGEALPPPPPPGEEGSRRRHQRTRQAHPVLGGSRRARRRAARRWSKAPVGGTRRSKPRASATPSRWPCCPTAPTPWTSATT